MPDIMKPFLKVGTLSCFLLAIAAVAAFLGSPLSCLAEKPSDTIPKCDAVEIQGKMRCELVTVLIIDGKAECLYDCVPIPSSPKAAAALEAIGAEARKVYATLDLKNPASIKKVNEALKAAHEERVAYAKKNNLTLTTKKHERKTDPSVESVKKAGAAEKK